MGSQSRKGGRGRETGEEREQVTEKLPSWLLPLEYLALASVGPSETRLRAACLRTWGPSVHPSGPSPLVQCGTRSLIVSGLPRLSAERGCTSSPSPPAPAETGKPQGGTPLAVQWVRRRAPNAGGPGSIPGRGTRSCRRAATQS